MPQSRRITIRRRPFRVCRLTAVLLAGLIAGCTPLSTITHTIAERTGSFSERLDSGGGLKKRVGVVPFTGRAPLAGERLQRVMQDAVIEAIGGACSACLLNGPGPSESFPTLANLPRLPSGRVDNLALASMGKKRGLNAIVTGALVDINVSQTTEGILWFKHKNYYVELFLSLSVYDTTTAAKLFDENVLQQIETDEPEAEMIAEKIWADQDELKRSIIEIGSELGRAAGKAIKDSPWAGHIIGVEGGRLIVSAGKMAEVTVGSVFEVYAEGSIIAGAEGERFSVAGPKTAEIQIRDVYEDRSAAILIEGEKADVGSMIFPK